MPSFFMLLCLALVVVAGAAKFKMRLNLHALQAEQAALTSKKQKVGGQFRLLAEDLRAIELVERELRLDCRDLVKALQAIQERMKKLEELAQKRVERQGEHEGVESEPPGEESAPGDAA